MKLPAHPKKRLTPKQALDVARNEVALSLPAVLAMGVTIGIFTTALMGTMMPVYRKAADLRSGHTTRALSELGIDYAINQLNVSIAAGQTSTLDPGGTVNAYATGTVPTNWLHQSGATVTVRVDNIGNPPATSMLYDALLNRYAPNSYRRITATANFGGTSKQIRAILQPVYSTNLDPQFPYAGFGIARFVFVGKTGTNSYNITDPRSLADVGSLGKISQVHMGNASVSRYIQEGGSHYEYPDPVSYYNQQFAITGQQFNASPASQAPWMQMYGNKYSNGGNTAYFSRTGASDSTNWHNVFGIDNGIKAGIPTGVTPGQTVPVNSPTSWSGGRVNFNPNPTTNGVTYQQPNIPPAPTAPPGTFNLGSVTIQGTGRLQINAGAPPPTGPIGTIANGQVRTIPPGDYIMTSLTMSGTSSVRMSGVTASNPTRLFMQGPSGGGTVISAGNTTNINMTGISGQGFATNGNNGVTNGAVSGQHVISPTQGISETAGSAKSLQIYYSGSGNMFLQGNARSVIYAPYATINLGATQNSNSSINALGQDANFYGSVTGAVVNLMADYTNGGASYLHYDQNLKNGENGYIDPYAQVGPFPNNPALQGYRAVSWQEAVETNVTNPASAKWTY